MNKQPRDYEHTESHDAAVRPPTARLLGLIGFKGLAGRLTAEHEGRRRELEDAYVQSALVYQVVSRQLQNLIEDLLPLQGPLERGTHEYISLVREPVRAWIADHSGAVSERLQHMLAGGHTLHDDTYIDASRGRITDVAVRFDAGEAIRRVMLTYMRYQVGAVEQKVRLVPTRDTHALEQIASALTVAELKRYTRTQQNHASTIQEAFGVAYNYIATIISRGRHITEDDEEFLLWLRDALYQSPSNQY